MGRIKSKLVKRTSHSLMKEENNFNENFDANKKLLKSLGTSKKIKNQIAGYIARINKKKVNQKNNGAPTPKSVGLNSLLFL
jgi:ribosomal protein S17E